MDNDVIKKIYDQTQMIVGWYADKYKAMIFRPATMEREGCRTWEKNGNKYICFWDLLRDRHTTAKNPHIRYKEKTQ